MAEEMVKHGDNCVGSLPNIVCFIHKVSDLLDYDVNYNCPRRLAVESYLAWYGFTTYPEHSAFPGG